MQFTAQKALASSPSVRPAPRRPGAVRTCAFCERPMRFPPLENRTAPRQEEEPRRHTDEHGRTRTGTDSPVGGACPRPRSGRALPRGEESLRLAAYSSLVPMLCVGTRSLRRSGVARSGRRAARDRGRGSVQDSASTRVLSLSPSSSIRMADSVGRGSCRAASKGRSGGSAGASPSLGRRGPAHREMGSGEDPWPRGEAPWEGTSRLGEPPWGVESQARAPVPHTPLAACPWHLPNARPLTDPMRPFARGRARVCV